MHGSAFIRVISIGEGLEPAPGLDTSASLEYMPMQLVTIHLLPKKTRQMNLIVNTNLC